MKPGDTLKHHLFAILATVALTGVPAAIMIAETGHDRSDSFNECDARCASLEGESRYRCVKTCINTKKRNSAVGNNEVKKKISECESLCEQYKGIDNVRCRRICLDNKKYIAPAKKEPPGKENPSPCESRCGVLSGSLKENCIMRCEKKNRHNSKADKN